MLFAPDIISQLKIVLNQFGNEYRIDNTEYWDRKKIISHLELYTPELVTKLLQDSEVRENYVENINGVDILKLNELINLFKNDNFWKQIEETTGTGDIIFDNVELFGHEVKDAHVLLSGMFATQLPPLLDQIITVESSSSLIEELAQHPKETLFEVDSVTNLLTKFVKGVKSPENIYGGNWATEAITFYTLKINDSWRPMAIPNIKHVVMFAYNSLLVAKSTFNQMYNKENRLNGVTKHSESPIIGRDGFFSRMLYEEIEQLFFNDIDEENTDPVGFIGYGIENKFFKDSKIQRYRIEATYPYVLQIDISKYFENIYTHLFDQIDSHHLELDGSSMIFSKYLSWLDDYNQKINNNHTKSIIQGPISSKISAELLQLSLDYKIEQACSNLKLDVNFTRYVDDYRFFGRNIKDLELLKKTLLKIFRQHELSFNESKIQLYKGFEQQKKAHLKKYPELSTITKGKNVQLSFKDYLTFREILSQVVQEQDLPTAKSILTNVTKQFASRQIIIKDTSLIIPLIEFLIKTTYVFPIVAMQIYKLMNEICDGLANIYRKEIWKILYSEMNFIVENYSDTDLEAWYFYTLANCGTADLTYRAINNYLKIVEKKSSVVVLSVVLKKKSLKANKKIHDYIISQVEDWQTVSQSKWWLPISKMWLVLDESKLDKKIKKLFISSNGAKTQWDKLGIIKFLKDKST
ncbi:RNA-directed DNA polymerase [Leuconostoc suionicum]|uniref:RNA-directed DNA polymerase n=1 Tax=Leuconostoc suionicum TaxID=1511761 RepID=UPI003D2DE2E5